MREDVKSKSRLNELSLELGRVFDELCDAANRDVIIKTDGFSETLGMDLDLFGLKLDHFRSKLIRYANAYPKRKRKNVRT